MKTVASIGKRELPTRWKAIGLVSEIWGSCDPDAAPGANRSAALIAFGLVYICIVGCVDLALPKGLDLGFFYLIGCALVGWKAGARSALVNALIAGVFLWRDEAGAGDSVTTWISFWNLVIHLAGFAATGWLASAAGRLTRHLDGAVQKRTASLQGEVEMHRETASRWHEMAQLFRQLTENITEVFWVSDPTRTRINYLSPGYQRIWGQPCKSAYQDPGVWLEAIHKEDRERVARAIRAGHVAGSYNEEYRVVRPDGTVRWVHDRAFPVRNEQQKLYRLAGITEDITERKKEEQLRTRLEGQVLEISDREQARIGQDIHDGLCQQLVGAAFAANSLEQSLTAQGHPAVSIASRISRLLDEAMTESRRVARGLFPVRLSTQGLGPALEELAAATNSSSGIRCTCQSEDQGVHCVPAVETHLYRIAREAVNNAVKHSQASEIVIRLNMEGGTIKLEISDNGKGIPQLNENTNGMGLHIMNYRARSIGAEFQIVGRSAGTLVSCVIPMSARESDET